MRMLPFFFSFFYSLSAVVSSHMGARSSGYLLRFHLDQTLDQMGHLIDAFAGPFWVVGGLEGEEDLRHGVSLYTRIIRSHRKHFHALVGGLGWRQVKSLGLGMGHAL